MIANVIVVALCTTLFALCTSALGEPVKIARIGILFGASAASNFDRLEAFRLRLRELGYVEAKNFLFEQRYADGKLDRLPALAAELVNSKLNVIVSGATAATRSLKQATTTIPIVMPAVMRRLEFVPDDIAIAIDATLIYGRRDDFAHDHHAMQPLFRPFHLALEVAAVLGDARGFDEF